MQAGFPIQRGLNTETVALTLKREALVLKKRPEYFKREALTLREGALILRASLGLRV